MNTVGGLGEGIFGVLGEVRRFIQECVGVCPLTKCHRPQARCEPLSLPQGGVGQPKTMARLTCLGGDVALPLAWQLGRCCTPVLYEHQKRPVRCSEPAGELGGRYWDRTSDLLGVNEALSR